MASSIMSRDRFKYTDYQSPSKQGENCFLNQPVLYKPWFQDKFSADLNRNLAAQMLFRYSNRWYGFRMDLLGTLTILCTAGVCIFSRGSVTPAEAGLALANVFQVATFIPYVMRMKADFRARFNSVERISE